MENYTTKLFKEYLYYLDTRDPYTLKRHEITLDIINEFYKLPLNKDAAKGTKTYLTDEETNWIQNDLRQSIWIIERSKIIINNPPEYSSIKQFTYNNNQLIGWINNLAVDCPPKIRSLLHFEYIRRMACEVNIVYLNQLLSQEWNQARLSIDSFSLWFKSKDADLKYEIFNKKLEKQSHIFGRLNTIDTFFNHYHHNLQPCFSDTSSKIEFFITINLTQQPDYTKTIIQDTKNQYTKKTYLLKNQSKKQHNLMLSIKLIEKLDKHAHKIQVSRSELIEGLVELYLNGTYPTKLQTLPLPLESENKDPEDATHIKTDQETNRTEVSKNESKEFIIAGYEGD